MRINKNLSLVIIWFVGLIVFSVTQSNPLFKKVATDNFGMQTYHCNEKIVSRLYTNVKYFWNPDMRTYSAMAWGGSVCEEETINVTLTGTTMLHYFSSLRNNPGVMNTLINQNQRNQIYKDLTTFKQFIVRYKRTDAQSKELND